MVRTQADRRWVQVEVPSDAGNTAFTMLDLNMIDQVSGVREGAGDEIIMTKIVYSGTMAPIVIKKDQSGVSSETGKPKNDAQWFYDVWTDFINLEAKQVKTKPGLIHRASGPAALIGVK